MQSSHSLKTNPQRVFRLAVLNSVRPPQLVVDQLEAQGINVSELEARIRHNMEFIR